VTQQLPVVDPRRCVGHGHCAAACPVDSLELKDGRPWLPRPRTCIGCGVCAAVCPTQAIHLEERWIG
jgi:NAD-dependent dihydropyrimidine dehydrogenase PreA subunit